MQTNQAGTSPTEVTSNQDVIHQSVPEGLHLEKDPVTLRISCSHFKPVVWQALVIGSLLILGSAYLIATGGLWAVTVALLGLGLLTVYSALVGLINQRMIQVTHDQLKVVYGPLPFERNHELKTTELVQLYTHKMATTSRYGDITGFTLEAILSDGKLIPLTSDPSYEKVHFLEIQIESWLGITDLNVPGEVPYPLNRCI